MSAKASGAVGRLPTELTSFVGRRHELAEVKQRLQVARLVTLTGIGGVGKTRLALRAAAAVQRAFEDSVCLVELGEVSDPSILADSVAAPLGISDRSNRPARQLIGEHLATRRLLLVLDNCEHLLDSVAELAGTLLKACPGVQILATSREPLNIDGESVIRVPPLALATPDSTAGSAEHSCTASEAITLFTERARSHVPGFELTPDNTETVIEICHRLEGLPLPIELAAARLRTLSASQILSHLTDRYRLLTVGRRGAPSRQQTLRSSVDWSRDLCSPGEQRLWARLSVFAGGAQLDAIDVVCADETRPGEILDLVGSLVDKSIVIREEPDSEVRYRMLDLLREYGRSDLISSGEYAEVRGRHCQYYRHLVVRAADEWISADRPAWANRLMREQANLREAMEYCFDEAQDSEVGLQIATSLYPYWLTCGRFSEGRRWLDHALDATCARRSTRARALLLNSVLAGLQGDTTSAAGLLAHAAAIAGGSDVTALTHYASGYVALYSGDSDSAVTHFAAAAAMFREDANVFLQWGSLEGLGLAHVFAGDMDQAVESLDEALAITATGEHPDLHAYPLWAMGIALWQQGESSRAATAVRRGLQISRQGDPLALAYSLHVSAWLSADDGDEQRAAVLLGAADTLWRQLSSATMTFPDMRKFAKECEHQIRNRLGAKEFTAAHERGAAMTSAEAAAYALHEQPLREARKPSEVAELTKREKEVADLVARGLTNRAIAEALVIAQRTAQGHVENILMKLGFTSRTQIAVWVAQHT